MQQLATVCFCAKGLSKRRDNMMVYNKKRKFLTFLIPVALVLIIALLILERDYTFFSFFKTLFIYLIICGTSLLFRAFLIEFLDPNDVALNMILSISIVFSTFFMRFLAFLTTTKKKTKKTYEVVVFSGNKEYKTYYKDC